jgi:hypothetical protein
MYRVCCHGLRECDKTELRHGQLVDPWSPFRLIHIAKAFFISR